MTPDKNISEHQDPLPRRAVTRALFAGSQGVAVARAGGNICGPLSARPDLKAPVR
jgi:hypothetical protein